jgi:hypothetical protein
VDRWIRVWLFDLRSSSYSTVMDVGGEVRFVAGGDATQTDALRDQVVGRIQRCGPPRRVKQTSTPGFA